MVKKIVHNTQPPGAVTGAKYLLDYRRVLNACESLPRERSERFGYDLEAPPHASQIEIHTRQQDQFLDDSDPDKTKNCLGTPRKCE
jgi:hypothetical protein